MSEKYFAECEWCRELDYALLVWKRRAGEDDLAHLLSARWGIDIALSRTIASVTRRAYETADILNRTDDAVEAHKAVVNAPTVLGPEQGLIMGYWLKVPSFLRQLYRRPRTGELEFYRDFVSLNPDPLLHQFERILNQVAERIEANLSKLERYRERVQEIADILRRVNRVSREIEEDLARLRELQERISEAIRDVTGRFRPGTVEYQRLWREIREYLRIYTGGFEYILRAIIRGIGS